jgi:hypothetical protein
MSYYENQQATSVYRNCERISLKDATPNWQQQHPLAGYAEFIFQPGGWVGGHGNLNEPCRWQEPYWLVVPYQSLVRQKPVFGLKAEPGGSVFAPGEGFLLAGPSNQ